VGENVLGLVNWNGGLVFDEVQADLEAEGYEVQPYVLPAVSVDSVHRRDRVWFVAYAKSIDYRGEYRNLGAKNDKAKIRGQRSSISKPSCNGNEGDVADAENKGLQRGEVIRGIGGIGQNGNKFPSGCVPPNWEEFPTQPPICSGDDGLPDRLDGITFSKWRNESIKGYGNAVVPQVVHQIFKTISLYESTSHEPS
jgi:DNA (cytosine-5)-methyltransferase 1